MLNRWLGGRGIAAAVATPGSRAQRTIELVRVTVPDSALPYRPEAEHMIDAQLDAFTPPR